MTRILTITIYTLTILLADAILQTHYEYVNYTTHVRWFPIKVTYERP